MPSGDLSELRGIKWVLGAAGSDDRLDRLGLTTYTILACGLDVSFGMGLSSKASVTMKILSLQIVFFPFFLLSFPFSFSSHIFKSKT